MKVRVTSSLFLVFWTAIRLISVLLVFYSVVSAYLINLILDGVDGDIFERFGFSRERYQTYDKWVDMWFYYVLVIYTLIFVDDLWMKILLFGFFAWRVIGMFIYFWFNYEWLLFLFPNIFSELLIAYCIFPEMQKNLSVVLMITSLSFLKEWWIHVAKFDLSNMVIRKIQKYS